MSNQVNLIRRKGTWFIGDVIQLAFCLPVAYPQPGLTKHTVTHHSRYFVRTALCIAHQEL